MHVLERLDFNARQVHTPHAQFRKIGLEGLFIYYFLPPHVRHVDFF